MKYKYKFLYYLCLIAFLITFNIFFGIFVWNEYDHSPNQAVAFMTLMFIFWTCYIWRMEYKEIINKIKDQQPKGEK